MKPSHGYSTIKMIGSGAFGKVYLVRKNNKEFAIKKIPFHNLEEKANIKKEIDILSSLNDNHIVKYYESFSDNESYNIVMDYYKYNLKDFINEVKKYKHKCLRDKNFIIRINSIIFGICYGLKKIHENNIIHRDLKPENIFMDKDSIKIGDFGISKKLSLNEEYCKTSVGTFNYMAPEILKGEKYNNKVDIWAFGCIIYELLTFERCFEDESIYGLIDKIINQRYKKLNINKKYEFTEEEEHKKEYEKYQNLIDKLLNKNYKERIDIFTLYKYLFDEIITSKNGKYLRFEISIGNSLLEYLNYFEPKYLNKITELDLDKRNILAIRNIENLKLPNLEILNLNDNKISDLSPLERVDFKKLKILKLFINKISDVSIFGKVDFKELEILVLRYNKISEISILEKFNFEKLEYLDLGTNEISDITILEKVDFKNLKKLNLSNNKISDITILEKVDFKNLKKLDLSYNKISDISILEKVDFKDLNKFDLSRNKISEISILAKIDFKNLNKFNLFFNNISDISILEKVDFKNLKEFDLSYNKISDISILEKVNFKDLKEFKLNYNNISDISILAKVDFKDLKELDLSYNKISDKSILERKKFSKIKIRV